jgi:tetratricopeptide (TPR) repeat protein
MPRTLIIHAFTYTFLAALLAYAPAAQAESAGQLWNKCITNETDISLGRADIAIEACTKLLEGGWSNNLKADILKNRGLAYSVKHDYDRAIADLSRALDGNAEDLLTLYLRAGAYEAKHEYDRGDCGHYACAKACSERHRLSKQSWTHVPCARRIWSCNFGLIAGS